MDEQGQVSERNEGTMWKKRTAGVGAYMELMKYIIHACQTLFTRDSTLHDYKVYKFCLWRVGCKEWMHTPWAKSCDLTSWSEQVWQTNIQPQAVGMGLLSRHVSLPALYLKHSTSPSTISECFICISLSQYVWNAETQALNHFSQLCMIAKLLQLLKKLLHFHIFFISVLWINSFAVAMENLHLGVMKKKTYIYVII